MSDPDQAWKPNNRPQSTLARNFMTELDSLFNLDNDLGALDSLDKTVLEKKQAVDTQTQELEALQARLREAEERLNQAKTSSPGRAGGSAAQHTATANTTANNTAAIPFRNTAAPPERPHSSQSRASVKV